MSLLLSDHEWPARIAAARGPLAPLACSLAHDLEPLLARVAAGDLYVPAEKALLSRSGGRCPDDGELLEFDPFAPHEHRCPRCGVIWRGESHDRFWPYWYQLWLAERAVQGALLHRLAGDPRHRALAIAILEAYVDRYPTYPNRDNVLGPSRPFFSTYLESIWLLPLAIACDLLDGEGTGESPSIAALGARVREVIVEPSVALIASYDEGLSNRQVWNGAALLAGRTLLGERDAVTRALDGPSGLIAHLTHALLPDGSWYEGENYHLFAHRGLWYSVTMLEARGIALDADLARRFDDGFVTPLLTALPDLTLPSRRDSQYAISLRQPRFAELAELGLARRDDDRLRGMLHALYDGSAPAGDTGRSRSTADVERNRPAVRLTRADLGWRALLHALPDVEPLEPRALGSVLLPSQGIAVFRRASGRRYVALDYGHSGGGHGHPDRLDLLLADGATRWLDDMGTGSYVDRSLHWYRSSLAHNAPLVDGRSQRRVHGRLVAYDERGAAGWIRAEAEIAPGVLVRRTVVVFDDYLVDRVEWSAERAVTFDLPLHVDGELAGPHAWSSATLHGGDGTEDGFDFLRDTERATLDQRRGIVLRASAADSSLACWLHAAEAAELWRATAPGPPGRGDQRFHLLRVAGASGRIDGVWGVNGAVVDAHADGAAVIVRLADGSLHRHVEADWGWHVDLEVAGARSSIDLGGVRERELERAERSSGDAPVSAPPHIGVLGPKPLRFALGESHYVRSEESWVEAGRPTAEVGLSVEAGRLLVEVELRKSGDLVLVPAGADNPYDNEPAEVNGDGVQLYVRTARDDGGWLLAPEAGGGVRVRAVPGWGALPIAIDGWRRTDHGFSLRAQIPLAGDDALAIDVIVNETVLGRTRRRGQLVLSGGGGFVYLRGDRHERSRLLPFAVQSA